MSVSTMQPVSPPEAIPANSSVRTILYIDHTAKMGGGEIALLHLVQYLDRRRYLPVVVLCAEGPFAEKLRESGVEVHVCPLDPEIAQTRKDALGASTLLRLKDVVWVLRYTLRLAAFIRRRGVDLVHTNSLKADIIGGVAARLAGKPLLWHVRDRIDEDYLPRPVVRVFRWLCRVVPHYVVANSESTLETIQIPRADRKAAVYSGIVIDTPHRVVHDGIKTTVPRLPVVYDGTHHAGVLSAESAARNRTGSIGLVGRISPWKGQHIFLRAAAKVHAEFPKVKFLVIGAPLFSEHEYEKEIYELTKTLGLEDCVEFLGFRSDVPELIASLDILVHASTSAEPFGQVVVEGMIAGKPVVATDGGGVREIVKHGETGLLVPMGESEPMAGAISFLLGHPDLAREMGQAGHDRACQHFSIDLTARRMESVYRDIVG